MSPAGHCWAVIELLWPTISGIFSGVSGSVGSSASLSTAIQLVFKSVKQSCLFLSVFESVIPKQKTTAVQGKGKQSQCSALSNTFSIFVMNLYHITVKQRN